MPTKKRKAKVWVWLTLHQIDALLRVVQAIESKPVALDDVLPQRGDRAAFHGAIAELAKVRDAMETSG